MTWKSEDQNENARWTAVCHESLNDLSRIIRRCNSTPPSVSPGASRSHTGTHARTRVMKNLAFKEQRVSFGSMRSAPSPLFCPTKFLFNLSYFSAAWRRRLIRKTRGPQQCKMRNRSRKSHQKTLFSLYPKAEKKDSSSSSCSSHLP